MKGKLIGAFTNRWRGRAVRIFEDTADPAMVYTEGRPLWGVEDREPLDQGKVIATHERRELFADYIGSFGKVYE